MARKQQEEDTMDDVKRLLGIPRTPAQPGGRYPTLVALTGVYRGLGVVLAILGVVSGLVMMSTGTTASVFGGFACIGAGILVCVGLLGASEIIRLHLDIEEHLRNRG